MPIKKITSGLIKTRNQIKSAFKSIFSNNVKIDDETCEQIEDILIQTDIGFDTVKILIEKIETTLSHKEKNDPESVLRILREELYKTTDRPDNKIITNENNLPTVILVLGINGTGKTTSVAKLSNTLVSDGKKVIVAACDTFRGAAIEQLEIWAKKTGTRIVKHQHGSDAAAVAYDAAQAAIARNADYLIIDTAGRLHTNKNLMEELKKIKRTVAKIIPNTPNEILITIDAVTGQNAIPQVKMFNQELNVTGIVLTKLDGTAKGGVVIHIQNELNIPVKFVGIGEGMSDLLPFDNKDFIDALFEG